MYDALMVFHRPRINIAIWVNMLVRAGLRRASAEEVSGQLDAELQQGVTREDLKDMELRLMVFLIILVGIATGIIVAVKLWL